MAAILTTVPIRSLAVELAHDICGIEADDSINGRFLHACKATVCTDAADRVRRPSPIRGMWPVPSPLLQLCIDGRLLATAQRILVLTQDHH